MENKEAYFAKPLKAIDVGRKSVSELLEAMSQTGFQGKKLGEAANVWTEMLQQNELMIFFGYAGSMSTTGQWKIIRWLIENRYIDVLVSTGANISEDIIEAMGSTYYQGTHLADDTDLLRLKIDRFYDVYADEHDYEKLNSIIEEFGSTLETSRIYSSREFLSKFGAYLGGRGIDCLLSAAYKNNVPVYSPALIDSAYGTSLSNLKRKGKAIIIDQTSDMEELATIAEGAKRTGVIYVGGGVPKDTVQLATIVKTVPVDGEMRVWKSHEYAIQITTDSPQWGGLSGCTLEEAISWGKITPAGKKVTVYSDATIALPLLAHAIYERVSKRQNPPKIGFTHTS